MAMSRNSIDYMLVEIIKRAIQERKLFELLFTEEGERLWKSYPEDKVKKLVRSILRRGK